MADQNYATVSGEKVERSDFAYAPEGSGPSEWKLPIHDESHVRNALARFNQTDLPAAAKAEAKRKILARAHKYGIDTSGFEKEHGSSEKASEEPRFVWPLSSAFFAEHQGGLKRIPIAITGTWARAGRKFSITLDHLKQMMSNFAKRRNGEVNLDYDHASEQPEVARGAEIPSAGRIVSLEEPEKLASGQHVLWGLCEPTDRAQELVRNREYRYISPAINFHGEDKETGDDQGATLTSVALTNRPFLEEMPQVQLSDPTYQLIDTNSVHVDGADPKFSVDPQQTGDAGKEKSMKKYTVRKIKAADSAEHSGKRGVFDDDGSMMGLAEVEPDEDDQRKLQAAEERFAQLLTDAGFEGQTEDEVRGMILAGVAAQERDRKESSMKTLLSECVVGSGLDEEKAANLLADQKVSKADYNAAREGQRRVQKAISEGRLLPRNGGQALRQFLSDPDLFKALVEERKPFLPLKPMGASRGPQTTSEDFLAMVNTYADEHKVPYRQALSEVSRQHPEMAKVYSDSIQSEVS